MGQLLRFLLLFLVIWLVLGAVRTALARRRRGKEREAEVDKMVPCAHCGVHIPMSQALLRNGKAYCSDTHRAAGPRQR
jgi:uncharacterized protein